MAASSSHLGQRVTFLKLPSDFESLRLEEGKQVVHALTLTFPVETKAKKEL